MAHLSLRTLPRCVRTLCITSPIINVGSANVSAQPIGVAEWGGDVTAVTFTCTTKFVGTGDAKVDIGYGAKGEYRSSADTDAIVDSDTDSQTTLSPGLSVSGEVEFTLTAAPLLYRGDVITVTTTKGNVTAGQGYFKVYMEPSPLYAEDDMTFGRTLTTTSTSTSSSSSTSTTTTSTSTSTSTSTTTTSTSTSTSTTTTSTSTTTTSTTTTSTSTMA